MTTLYLYLPQETNPDRSQHSNDGGFVAAARELAERSGAELLPFRDGQQAIHTISQYNRIDRLVLFAHGAPDSIGWHSRQHGGGGIHVTKRINGWRILDSFTDVLAPRLSSGTIIGLAACTCGQNPEVWERQKPIETRLNGLLERQRVFLRRGDPVPDALRRQIAQINTRFAWASRFTASLSDADGAIQGQDSFAYLLRDQLLTKGASGIEVRAHLWSGHTTQNPSIISFSPPLGSSGNIVARDVYNIDDFPSRSHLGQQWRREWTGELAQAWIIGGEPPVIEGEATITSPFGSRASFLPEDNIPRPRGNTSVIPNSHTGGEDPSETPLGVTVPEDWRS